MKTLFLFFFIAMANHGLLAQVKDSNRHTKNNFLINKIQVNTLDGRPMGFYLNHSKIDKISKKFYQGEYRIAMDSIPPNLMDSLLTKNPETRPFYFLIFNQIVEMSNERMEEVVTLKCLNFIEKYPCDFFNFFNQPEININVVKWTTYIGKALKDKNNFVVFKVSIDSKLKANCLDVQDLSKSFLNEVRMCLIR